MRTASHVRSLLTQAQAARKLNDLERLVDGDDAGRALVEYETGETSVGKLTLVDLAPAQLVPKKGEAYENHNLSIATLVSIIDSLSAAKAKKSIDFEQSAPTMLLQDSLGQLEVDAFLTVDLRHEKAALSTQCLQFAEKAKGVKLGAASKNKESMHTAMTKVNTTRPAPPRTRRPSRATRPRAARPRLPRRCRPHAAPVAAPAEAPAAPADEPPPRPPRRHRRGEVPPPRPPRRRPPRRRPPPARRGGVSVSALAWPRRLRAGVLCRPR